MLPALLAVGAIAAVVLLLIGIFGRGTGPASLGSVRSVTPTTSATTVPPSTPATTTPITPSTPTTPTTPVIVLNSTDTSGLASRVSAYLVELGWQVGEPDNYFPLLEQTTVYYPEGQEAAARLLAAAVPGTADTVSPAIPEVPPDALTVVLGTDAADWVEPGGTTPPTT